MKTIKMGSNPHRILQALKVGPKTTKELCEMLGLPLRKKGEVMVHNRVEEDYRYAESFYSGWPTTRARLTGTSGMWLYGDDPIPAMVYNKHTRKYSITLYGRKLLRRAK